MEAAKIPYNLCLSHLYGAYFVNVLLRQSESQDEVVVYGSGATKGILFSKIEFHIL